MPQHKSAAKRVRQSAKRREQNRYHRSRVRTLIKKLHQSDDATEAQTLLREAKSYLDRLGSKGIFHQNKVANYKSTLEKHVNALQ